METDMTREEAFGALKEKLDYYERDKRLKAACETLIPELRESEDEKIIEELIEYLTVTRQIDFVSRPDRQRWITYLEKQKESLHIPETCKENANSFTGELEKEFEKYLSENIEFDRAGSAMDKWNEGCHLNRNNLEDIARYFYELGLNSK